MAMPIRSRRHCERQSLAMLSRATPATLASAAKAKGCRRANAIFAPKRLPGLVRQPIGQAPASAEQLSLEGHGRTLPIQEAYKPRLRPLRAGSVEQGFREPLDLIVLAAAKQSRAIDAAEHCTSERIMRERVSQKQLDFPDLHMTLII
jgi:hypothetical protein